MNFKRFLINCHCHGIVHPFYEEGGVCRAWHKYDFYTPFNHAAWYRDVEKRRIACLHNGEMKDVKGSRVCNMDNLTDQDFENVFGPLSDKKREERDEMLAEPLPKELSPFAVPDI